VSAAILVLNAGSSTVKYAAYALDRSILERVPLIRESLDASPDALQVIWPRITRALAGRALIAVGHRIVHGGMEFSAPMAITPDVARRLAALIPLAPLHQPQGLALIEPLRRCAPAATQVACFDTVFHRTMPELAQMFALPREFTASGVRAYGFHGLSYEYVAGQLPPLLAGKPQERVIVAHLGNGSSLCAMRDLKSVATTMTFTPLDGLPMATRSGSIDAGVVLYLARERGMPIAAIDELLNHRSGLLGVSELSGDVRVLLASSDPRAALALDLLVYRVRKEIGALAVVLGGLDALVFTGGIGGNSAELRGRICADISWLGIEIDPNRNAANAPRLTADGSRISVWQIATDEESVIARHAASVVAGQVATTVPTDAAGQFPGV
jgi:acetate kinase